MDAKSGSERLLFLYLNRLKHLNKEHGYNYPVLFNDKSRNDIGNNEKAALTLIESRIPGNYIDNNWRSSFASEGCFDNNLRWVKIRLSLFKMFIFLLCYKLNLNSVSKMLITVWFSYTLVFKGLTLLINWWRVCHIVTLTFCQLINQQFPVLVVSSINNIV